MTRIAIELDDDLVSRLDKAAAKAGKSRTDWAREVLEERLSGRLPEWWFRVLGTWDDARTPDQILADIRSGPEQSDRPALS
jgi:predicted transcriptional regulator